MDAPMNRVQGTPPDLQQAEAHQVAADISKWWWAWLVSGVVWILAAIVILQFRQGSLSLVGIIIGVMFLVAGIQEFAVTAVSGGWRWLGITLGILFIIGGIYALFNPVGTVLAVADVLGFLFALVGVFWVIEAFATMAANPVWWLGLISGIAMLILGFWAAGQFFTTQVYALLVFAGIWAIFHGISDIVKAFIVKDVGTSAVA